MKDEGEGKEKRGKGKKRDTVCDRRRLKIRDNSENKMAGMKENIE